MAAIAGSLIGGGVSAITSLVGSGKQASAIKSAATTEANAADYSANLTSQAEANSLAYTKGTYADTQANVAPYQAAGDAALGELGAGTAAGGEFNSTPTGDQVLAQDPGYAFRIAQGQTALERAESAGGSVASGGALKAGVDYGQQAASAEYNSAYQRFMTTRQDNYSNLSNIAGFGQSANSISANAGTGASSNVSNTSLTGTATQGSDLMGAANATAAGGIGVANVQAGNLSSIGTATQQAIAASGSGYGTGYGAGTPVSNAEADDWLNPGAGSTSGQVP